MAKKDKKSLPGEVLVCSNPKALQRFEIEQRLECGIALAGPEVKSLRARAANLEGAFGGITDMELWLQKFYIGPYPQAGYIQLEPRRSRKLLAHKREIEKLWGKLAQRGYTLIPLRVYFKNGHAKVELGLGKAIKRGDKRQALREEIALRDARDAIGRGRT